MKATPIITVVAVVGLITAFVVPPYLKHREQARQARIEEQRPLCQKIVQIEHDFLVSNGRPPADEIATFERCMARQVDGEALHTGVFIGT